MARSTSIQLNDRWDTFLAERVASGRFDSVSEAVRAGLRLLQIEEEKFERLMILLKEGRESGPSVPFDMETWLAEQRDFDQAA